MSVYVCPGGMFGRGHVFAVTESGGVLDWVIEVWPLMPNRPPGPRLGHSLVTYPLLHLGMNGINPNPVYRHPYRSMLNCI